MSRQDRLEGLDQKIASSLQAATDELRRELGERLQEVRGELVHAIRATGTEAPADRDSLLAELRLAVRELLEASSQKGILDRLVRVATRFGSRAAFFLLDDSGAHPWSAQGFPPGTLEAIRDDGGAIWGRLVDCQGATRLGPEDCRQLLGGAGRPDRVGTLIPLALADRLAGALYVEGAATGSDATLIALQLLVQSASHSIESLPLRQRHVPVTLRTASEVAGPGDGLELWPAGGLDEASDTEAGPDGDRS